LELQMFDAYNDYPFELLQFYEVILSSSRKSTMDLEHIKQQLNCSEACAKDVYHLRSSLDWSLEKEQELINLHSAGVSLLSHE
jgi:hypothetical protein